MKPAAIRTAALLLLIFHVLSRVTGDGGVRTKPVANVFSSCGPSASPWAWPGQLSMAKHDYQYCRSARPSPYLRSMFPDTRRSSLHAIVRMVSRNGIVDGRTALPLSTRHSDNGIVKRHSSFSDSINGIGTADMTRNHSDSQQTPWTPQCPPACSPPHRTRCRT